MERSARAELQDPQFVNSRFFGKFQAGPQIPLRYKRVMLGPALTAARRSPTGCRQTSVAAPRPRPSEKAGTDGSQTLYWRKTDSNSRSLREGKGCRQPRQASIALFGPELVSGSAFRAAVSDCNAQKSL